LRVSGFGLVALDAPPALESVAAAVPETLTSGADLPWTRAGRPFEDGDLDLIRRVLGPDLAEAALHRTAAAFCRA
jgi:hypothetical protein